MFVIIAGLVAVISFVAVAALSIRLAVGYSKQNNAIADLQNNVDQLGSEDGRLQHADAAMKKQLCALDTRVRTNEATTKVALDTKVATSDYDTDVKTLKDDMAKKVSSTDLAAAVGTKALTLDSKVQLSASAPSAPKVAVPSDKQNPKNYLHLTGPDAKGYDAPLAAQAVWTSDGVQLAGASCVETGTGDATKEVNAGKICYGKFSDGLDIVGKGTTASNRKVRLWDKVETPQGIAVLNGDPGPMLEKQYGTDAGNRYGMGQFPNGVTRLYAATTHKPATVNLSMAKGDGSFTDVVTVDNSSNMTVRGNVLVPGQGCVETGSGDAAKEVNAGKICYGKFSDGLDIVGKGTTGSNRKVRLWDKVETPQGVAVLNGDPGPMLEKQYGTSKGDRYGVGQFAGGTMRVYAANAVQPATVSMSMAKVDGTFKDMVTADNNDKVTVRGSMQVANNTAKNNVVVEAGRSSDNKNEGWSAINFNGSSNNGEQVFDTTKGRWRMAVNQVGASDFMALDQYKNGKFWPPITMDNGTIRLKGTVTLCDANGQNCRTL